MKQLGTVAVLALQSYALAETNAVDVLLTRQRLASEEKIAWVYAGAIVIAGAFIGLGVYFGFRSRKD